MFAMCQGTIITRMIVVTLFYANFFMWTLIFPLRVQLKFFNFQRFVTILCPIFVFIKEVWKILFIASVCRKVGRQIDVINWLTNILLMTTKQALYYSFVLLYIAYCSYSWHHCCTKNAQKLEKNNERAVRLWKQNSYYKLLVRAGQVTLENRVI